MNFELEQHLHKTKEEVVISRFKSASLEALGKLLTEKTYPGYPTERLTTDNGAYRLGDFGSWYLPHGPWHIQSQSDKPLSEPERNDLRARGYGFDTERRPLHPWLKEMVTNPEIGVITGKGFYWQWGPNNTADAIITRYDQPEPHMLLITRKDTGQLALPGGFIDKAEKPLEAAYREAYEETLLPLEMFDPLVTEIYSGPLADIRVTANAWPETTAYSFELEPKLTRDLPLGPFKAGDDADTAMWIPLSELPNRMFGSHGLLASMAIAKS